jgi:hypothetical protein
MSDDGGIQYYQQLGQLEEIEMSENVFEKLYKLNVSEHVEKKGRFSYLSWPYAVAELRKAAPDATWETIKFDGKPYCETAAGCFVEVAVTVNGITLSQIHPVLDNNNKTIPVPSAFQINTSIQRCLVKAIALHGLGLYIYAGEDLPEDEPKIKTPKVENFRDMVSEKPVFTQERTEAIHMAVTSAIDAYAAGDIKGAYECVNLDLNDNEERLEAWSRLKDMPTLRRALKEYSQSIHKPQKEAA